MSKSYNVAIKYKLWFDLLQYTLNQVDVLYESAQSHVIASGDEYL